MKDSDCFYGIIVLHSQSSQQKFNVMITCIIQFDIVLILRLKLILPYDLLNYSYKIREGNSSQMYERIFLI